MLPRTAVAACAGIGLIVVAAPAFAQDAQPAYVGASLGGFRVSADAVDGSSPAGGVVAGIGVTPWLDLEVDVVRPSRPVTRTYGGDALSLSFAEAGASPEEIERMGVWLRYDVRRDVSVSIGGAAIFHPPATGRVTPGFVIGVTNQRVRERRDYTPVRIGPGLDPNHPHAGPRAETGTRMLGALTIGANVAIRITRHVAIVPDLRYDYGSIGDEINNAWRSSVRVVWRF